MKDKEKIQLLILAFNNADCIWKNIDAGVLESFASAITTLYKKIPM